MSEQEHIEISEHHQPQHTVIWLHGLGADGNDFVPMIKELGLPKSLGIRFIFPHAPFMPVTINQGYRMRAWFDIVSLSVESAIDKLGIVNAVSMIEKIIAREEKRGVPASNIIVGGFSQGATVALATGLHYSPQIAGVIALSGFLPSFLLTNQHRELPIFLAHGSSDMVVPFALGKMTLALLEESAYSPSWHQYPIAHSVSPEEVVDIREWILKIWNQ